MLDQGLTKAQKLRRAILKQGEKDAIREIKRIRHQSAPTHTTNNRSNPWCELYADDYTADHQNNSQQGPDLRRLIPRPNYSGHQDDKQYPREHQGYVASSSYDTTQWSLAPTKDAQVNRARHQSLDESVAGPSRFNSDGRWAGLERVMEDVKVEIGDGFSRYHHHLQAQNASLVNVHQRVLSNTTSVEEVYKSIQEIELEEYRKRKQMVNDFAKLCKTIPLTVKMVNPLVNFDGWPNNTIMQ